MSDLISLSVDNLILRGSKISVNNEIIGAVVYTGKQTKIQMNNLDAKYKHSRLDHETNKSIVMILIG